jgi:hypothetical protein
VCTMRPSFHQISISLMLVFLSSRVLAYSFNYIEENKPIKWRNSTQLINVDTSGISSLSSSESYSIISDIVNRWNQSHPQLNTQLSQTQSSNNKLSFSNSSLYLGPNVVGVTVTTHDLQTGDLLEAEIIINDNFNFSVNPQADMFLGDVISHELGHFWGLGHSQLLNSSMFYRLRKGQHVPHSDDIAGLKSLYPFEISSIGSISGKIVAGKNQQGVFGAHVSAISLKSGKFAAATITNSNGDFKIDGLPIDDDYFIYVDQLKGKDNFSPLYRDTKSDFCNSGFAYRGSFYQSCLRSEEGFPFATRLTSVSRHREVGPISIRCNLDVPTDYMMAKGSDDPFSINLSFFELAPLSMGESFVGFFTNSEAKISKPDVVRVDLSEFDLLALFGAKDLYLELDIGADEFFSKLHLLVDANRINGESFVAPHQSQTNSEDIQFDEFGNPTTRLRLRVPLSLVDPTENIYEFSIVPSLLQEFVDSRLVTLDQYIVGHEVYADELLFYLFSFKIVERKIDNSFFVIGKKDFGPARSNLNCLDANQVYDVKSPERVSSQGGGLQRRRPASGGQDGALGCGLILLDSSSGGGPTSPGRAASCLLLVFLAFLISDTLKKRLVS